MARALVAGAVLWTSGACSGSDGGGSPQPDLPRPTNVTVSPATLEFEASGATASLTAAVTDQFGAAMDGVTLTWSSSNSSIATVSPSGLVTAVATGSTTIRATAGNASGTAGVTVAIRPVALELVGGNSQVGAAAEPLEDPLQVRALDTQGNPAPGAIVVFEVIAGGGSLTSSRSTADSEGIAEGLWTLGDLAGDENRVEAKLENGEGETVAFDAEAIPGAVAKVVIEAGGRQSARRNTELPNPVRVRVTDKVDNGVPGATVTYEVRSGGGSVTPTSDQVGDEGRGSVRWTLGVDLGDQILAIRSDSAETQATATATTTPTAIAATAGDNQTAIVGEPLPEAPSVRVTDADGLPVSGIFVTFTVTAGGGSVSELEATAASSAVTVQADVDGMAKVQWTLGTTAGTNNQRLQAAVDGLSAVAEFIASGRAAAPAALAKISGDEQDGGIGLELAAPLVTKVSDTFGNPVSDVTVGFAVSSGDGTLSSASAVSDSLGRAQVRWTLGAPVGVQSVEVSVPDIDIVTFTATGRAIPAAVEVVAGDGQTAQVDTEVSDAPSVRVTTATGLLVDSAVVTFEVTVGNGSVSNGSETGTLVTVSTDSTGIASLTAWKLGTAAGAAAHQVSAVVEELPAVTFSATATPGPAATLAVSSGDAQSAGVGTALPAPIVVGVTDAFGNPVAGVNVAFAITSGRGALSAASATTDANGEAGVTWTLGPDRGAQSVEASAASLGTVAFSATATATPAKLLLSAGDGQTAEVNSVVAQAPTVQVLTATDLPVEGAVVTFTVTQGGGSVSNGSTSGNAVQVSADASGMAALASWTLGTTAGTGNQQLTASASGVTSVTITASATAGAATAWSKLSGDAQSAEVGTALPNPLVVEVVDAFGNGVSGVSVSFTASEGSIGTASATTNSSGQAQTSWTLGSTVGAQTVTASSDGLSDLTFAATGAAPAPASCTLQAVTSGFDIQLCYLTSVSAAVQSAFENARTRWESLITGDVVDHLSRLSEGACGTGSPAISRGTFDDLLIFVTIEPIDGAFNILGSAGPCYVRSASYLPFAGHMRFDEADMDRLAASGSLENVILHEMGHVLGIGTLWDLGPNDLLRNPTNGVADPTVDTHFIGAGAIAAFDAAGGAARTTGEKVPVENQSGGAGTLDGHWRESTMNAELMTGFLDSGTNPLSAISVESLADIGYVVDASGADAYTVFDPQGVSDFDTERDLIRLVDDILIMPIRVVDPNGNVVRIIPR